MKHVYPRAYRDFSCIASACRHTCCAGWQIDIDADTADRYRGMEGAIGEEIRASLLPHEGGVHFATVKNGYDCPISGLTVHYQYLAENKKPLGGGNAWLLERLEAGAEKEISARIAVPVSNIAEVAYSVDFDALTLVADEGETI